MTTKTLRPILEGTKTSNREFVSSGLQSSQFGDEADGADAPLGGYNWRMVIKTNSTGGNLKMICCRGECNGKPTTAPGPKKNGFSYLLYDIDADPFDMHDLAPLLPATTESMRQLLPASFGCPALPSAAEE